MPIIKTCETCKILFSVPPCRNNAKYCSMKCMPRSGELNRNWKGGLVSCECKICGKIFNRKNKDVKKSGGKYCSLSCNGKAQGIVKKDKCDALRIVKNCKICNAEIKVKPSHADKEGTYCSKQCMSIGYMSSLKGSNNPNYRSGGICHTPEYIKAASKKWRVNNPESVRIYRINRRSLEAGAAGKLSKNLLSKLLILQKGKCACCKIQLSKTIVHRDHINPLFLGGHNMDNNIQLLCCKCNQSKGKKHPIDFMQSIGFLL